ncbi:MAG: TonB-dependent receptor [Novosphingobium sp.]
MRTIRMLATASVSLLAIASPAIAQDTAAKDSDQSGFVTDEIVVEARRRDESVQDVPLVVQAVTSQDLADLNIREFKDIQTLVPGLSLSSSANGIGTQAAIRGIAYDVNASGNNGTIEFYMNDAHLSSGMLFQSMFDVQQIEVLRGPQGTLRGRASPSGSITVTTTRPNLSEAGGYGSAQINDIGGWNFNGAINVPIIADKLAIRIAGVVDENNDNRVHSINNSTKPSSQMEGIRVSALFEPFDGLTLGGFYTSTSRDVVNFDQVESMNIADPTAAASPLTIRAKDRLAVQVVPRTYSQNFEIYNWSAEWRAFGQKLNYVGAVNKQSLTAFAPTDTGNAYPAAMPLNLRSVGQLTNTESKENFHEIRLSSDERIAGIFDYVIGYFYDKLDAPTNLIQQTPIFIPGVLSAVNNTPIFRGGGSTEESFLANVNAHIGDDTEISGGIRRIKYDSNSSLLISGVQTGPVEDRTFKHTIYSASIKHNFDENFMAYASFGTSWRPGSATNPIILRENVRPDATISSLYFPNPETSESYEIGIKSDWLDKRLRVNLTAFHQDFKNYAYSARNIIYAGTDSAQVNRVFTASPGLAVGVPAKVDGVEAEVSFQATPQWSLNLVAAYAKSKIKNGNVPCNDYNPNDGVPDTLPSAPTYQQVLDANGGAQIALCDVNYRAGTGAPFNMTFQTQYDYPFSDSLDGYVRGLVTYYGDSQNDPANAVDDIKDYGVVNLFAGIRDPDGAWDLGLYGKNVFDVLRVTNRTANALTANYQVGRTGVNAVSTYRNITITNPQEFGVTFRAAFGSR